MNKRSLFFGKEILKRRLLLFFLFSFLVVSLYSINMGTYPDEKINVFKDKLFSLNQRLDYFCLQKYRLLGETDYSLKCSDIYSSQLWQKREKFIEDFLKDVDSFCAVLDEKKSAERSNKITSYLEVAAALSELGEYRLACQYVNKAILTNTCPKCVRGIALKLSIFGKWTEDLLKFKSYCQKKGLDVKIKNKVNSQIEELYQKSLFLAQKVAFSITNLDKLKISIYFYRYSSWLGKKKNAEKFRKTIDNFFKKHPLYRRNKIYSFWKKVLQLTKNNS